MFIDLHVHLRGTIRPDTVRRLAKRHSIALPDAVVSAIGYGWHNFASFITKYDQITSVIRTSHDLEEVAYEYLSDAGASGTIYVEFMMSPPDLLRAGVSFVDQINAIQAAADRAREEFGIECRLIPTAVRHLGPRAAIDAARTAVARTTDLVVGFGLTGDECQFRVEDFEEAFRIARGEGLQVTAHAGEHLGANSIVEAIDRLKLDRVGHGIRAIESPSVTKQLAASNIPLEICISSNIALGLCQDIGTHPIAMLAAAGCTVTLGTDDPAFFMTSPDREYRLAGAALSNYGVTHDITECAIKSAFCSNSVKEMMRSRVASRNKK